MYLLSLSPTNAHARLFTGLFCLAVWMIVCVYVFLSLVVELVRCLSSGFAHARRSIRLQLVLCTIRAFGPGVYSINNLVKKGKPPLLNSIYVLLYDAFFFGTHPH